MTVIDTDDDKMIARLAELGVRVAALRETGGWSSYLRTAATFHRYSMHNLLMIWSQRPDATAVAGYRKWQELGRQVRKGERGIVIFTPRIGKDEHGDRKLRGFGTGRVFDVSQTEGDDLPAPPEWPASGTGSAESYQAIVDVALATGVVEVHSVVSTKAAYGWYTPATKEINVNLAHCTTVAQECSTLLHELGHHVDPALVAPSDENELVAESTAYLVAPTFNVGMTDEAEHYLAGYGGTDSQLLAVAYRVVTGAKTILEAAA